MSSATLGASSILVGTTYILKPFYSKDFLINDHMLNLVVSNNFKINRKVIDKEFGKIQIARKTAEKNIHS